MICLKKDGSERNSILMPELQIAYTIVQIEVVEVQWLIYALLSAVTAAFVAIFGKIGLEGVDSITASGVRAGIMFAVIIALIVVTGRASQIASLDSKSLFYIFLGGLAGAASWVFYFLALQYGKASQVAPIDQLSVVFVIVLAALFLGEKISPTNCSWYRFRNSGRYTNRLVMTTAMPFILSSREFGVYP
jgi:transporter family protein